MNPPASYLITPLSRERIARITVTARLVQPASIRVARVASPFSRIVRFVVSSLALLYTLAFPVGAQNVGDFSVLEKTASSGRVTPRYWPKGASTLWGTNSSSLPARIVVGTGLSLSGSPLTLTATGGGSGGAATLDELTDVTITSAATGQLLRYNGTSWVNYTHGFLTSSDLSSYVTSATAASTYAPLASPTFTGTVTIPSGASISGYATTAAVAAGYQPLNGTLTSISTVGGDLTVADYGLGLLLQSSPSAIRTYIGSVTGLDVQAYDADLADLADGSLTGNKVGAGVSAANITSGTLPDARLSANVSQLGSSISLNTEVEGVLPPAKMGTGFSIESKYLRGDGTWQFLVDLVDIGVAASDETTAISTGNGKVTFRMPHTMLLTAVRMSLTTASSSGLVTVDINQSGASILTTKLSCDAGEKTSTTAATAAVIGNTVLADDAEITVDFDAAGTGATGVKI